MDALAQAREAGLHADPAAWRLQTALLDYLETVWDEPDEGIWEVRGDRRHFVHSKVMAWVAFDRAVQAVERHGHDGPVDRWRDAARRDPRRGVRARASTRERNTFTQSYGSRGARRRHADDPARRLPARRTTRGSVGTVDAIQARAGARRLRAPLRLRGGRRRPAARRGRVPALLVLARRLPLPARPPRRGARAVRPARRARQRRRPARRGVRPARRAARSATSRRPSPTSAWSTPP